MSDVISEERGGESTRELSLTSLVKEPNFRTRVYDALKQAIIDMDI